jgi:hypothetical protein
MKFIQLITAEHHKVSVRADHISMITPTSAFNCRILVNGGPALLDLMHPAEEVLRLISGPAPAVYDEKETALILAGLRSVQEALQSDGGLPSAVDDLVFEPGPWRREEYKAIIAGIDNLCEKVNCA